MNLIVTNLPFVPDIGGINSMTLHCLYNIHLNLLLVNFILIFYILLPLYLSKKIILLSYYVSLLFLIPNRWPVSSSLLSGNSKKNFAVINNYILMYNYILIYVIRSAEHNG